MGFTSRKETLSAQITRYSDFLQKREEVMYAKLYSSSVLGIDGYIVEVEVDISNGLPVFDLVGLPDSAVRESRERVRAAVKNSDCQFPLQRITTNLAPADLKKEGSSFDLAIAVGVLIASGQVSGEGMAKTLLIGELALDGMLRPLAGVLSMVIAGVEGGFNRVILPVSNAAEARLVDGMEVIPVWWPETVAFLRGEWQPEQPEMTYLPAPRWSLHWMIFPMCRGQAHVKRAMEVAAGECTISFSWDLQVPEKPCWPEGSPPSCRR